jgi:tetratricopeptide (TPR) repeat protein
LQRFRIYDFNISANNMKQLICLFVLFISSLTASAQSYDEWVSKSFDQLDSDDLEASAESLRSAMRLEPGNPQNFLLLTNLGTLQRRLGQKKEALISYSAGLGIHPKSITLLENRASLYSELNEPEKAINDYNYLLIESPHHQEAIYCRGLLHVQLKNFIDAQIDFDALLELNEKSVRARLGHAILERSRGNYIESQKIYDYLIGQMPEDYVLYSGRAELFFLMGKNARAMGDMNKVFANSKPEAYDYFLRGKIKLAQYERESAQKDFATAKELGYDTEAIEEVLKRTKEEE